MSTNKLTKLKKYIGTGQERPNFGMDEEITDKPNFRKHINNDKTKKRFKLNFILGITLIIATLFFCIYNLRIVSNNWPEVNSKGIDLIQQMSKVLSQVKNDQNLVQAIRDYESSVDDLKQSLEPIDKIFWPFKPAETLTDEATQLFKDWIDASKDILQFSFTNQGFTSDLPRNFTDYLGLFFDKLPELNQRTENLLNKISTWFFFLPDIDSRINNFKKGLNLAREVIKISQELQKYRSQILRFLGADRIHKVLIFNQNLGESRPTGGFIGSYISVNLSKGRLDIGPSQSIYFADNSKLKPMLSFPAAWYYSHEYGVVDEHGVRNLNFFPCYPTSAQMIEREFSELPNGQSADTVIFLTTNLIRALFTDETELKVNESTEITNSNSFVLTKANFYDQIERLTALEFENPDNPKAAISPILTALLANLNSIIKQQDPINLAISLVNLGPTRDIQLWSKASEINKLWNSFNLAGDQTCQDSNKSGKLAFLMGNISADKRDILANHKFSFKTENYRRFTVNYHRSYSNLRELQRRLNTIDSLTFIGFQLPANANNYEIKSENALTLPFRREFYEIDLKNKTKLEAYTPPEIESVINSSIDLPNNSFKYLQPDGSLVIGLYVAEQADLKIQLQFDLDQQSFTFYPGAGTSQTEVSVNNNLKLNDTLDWQGSYKSYAKVNGQGVGITTVPHSIWHYFNCGIIGCYNPNKKYFI